MFFFPGAHTTTVVVERVWTIQAKKLQLMVQMAALKSDLFFYSQRCFLTPALLVAVTFSEELSDDVKGCVQDMIVRVHT